MLLKSEESKKVFSNGIAWSRQEAEQVKNRWEYLLPENAVVELRHQLKDVVLNKVFLEQYKGNEFEFPELKKLAVTIKKELLTGIGFIHLRGIRNATITDNELRFIYLVLCLEMGTLSTRYDRLYDVYDRGGDYTTQRIPVSQTKASTNFHTDSTSVNSFPDIIGLLCINQAKEGGESLLASALEAHEQLKQTEPRLLELLYKDFVRDIITPGDQVSLEQLRKNTFPVFSEGKYTDGVSFRYMRYWIETGAQKSNNPLSDTAIKALDYLDDFMNDDKHQLQLKLERGDILFANNHTIAHNRTAYIDHEEKEKKRLLVRTWIHV